MIYTNNSKFSGNVMLELNISSAFPMMSIHILEIIRNGKREKHGPRIKCRPKNISGPNGIGYCPVYESQDLSFNQLILDQMKLDKKEFIGYPKSRINTMYLEHITGFAVFAREEILAYSLNHLNNDELAKNILCTKYEEYKKLLKGGIPDDSPLVVHPKVIADMAWSSRHPGVPIP